MRIPIICNASPLSFQKSSEILLRTGNWKIVDDLVDTEYQLNLVDCEGSVENIVVTEMGICSIEIIKKGTEDSINIFAQRL